MSAGIQHLADQILYEHPLIQIEFIHQQVRI